MAEYDMAGATMTAVTGIARSDRSAVDAATSNIGEAISCLHDLISKLEGRLDPVLRPTEPTPSEGKDTLASVRADSPHAERLRDHSDAINAAGSRLHRLLDRLDV